MPMRGLGTALSVGSVPPRVRRAALIPALIPLGDRREAPLGWETLQLRDGRESPGSAKGREGLRQEFFPHRSEDRHRAAADGDYPFLLRQETAERTLRLPLKLLEGETAAQR